jgi:integral membrane protein (TIGR01906 family)
MKKKKGKKDVIIFSLLIITTIVLIPLINFNLIIYNRDLLKNELDKLNVYENFEDKTYPSRALGEILDYFTNENAGNPEIEGFNERENSHMRDVKLLINRIIFFEFCLIFLWIILFLIFILDKKNIIYKLSKILFYSGGSLIILILFFIIVSIFAFNYSFIIFHKLFFTGETWLFPVDSTIIELFPAQFFQNMFIKIIINTGLSAVLFFIVGFFIVRFRKLK